MALAPLPFRPEPNGVQDGASFGDDDLVLGDGDLAEKLNALYREMRADPLLAGITRVAAAVYDPKNDTVKTFLHASDGPNAVGRYTARLYDLPGLSSVARTGRPLIVGDLRANATAGGEQTRRLADLGMRSRYVTAIRRQGVLYGFLFFNSTQPGCFTPDVLARLVPYRRVITLMVAGELALMRAMLGAVHTARTMSRHRDEETGGHLERMAHFAQLIARRLAVPHGLSDAFLEYLFQYAPLHDIGKVAVPDHILLKPGRLTPEEFAVMQTHVLKGLEIVDGMRRDHGLQGLPYGQLLANIIAHHHETVDGSGYPQGLSGDAVSIEGRITTVADVFDALTSVRPYKAAWSNADALAFLREKAGSKFDPDCVEALAAQMEAVEEIQRRFRDESLD